MTFMPPIPDMPAAPHRRYELVLKLGADSWKEIIIAIRNLDFALVESCGESEIERDYWSLSGGYNSSYQLDVQFDADMDHDKYVEANQLYLIALNERKSKDGEP